MNTLLRTLLAAFLLVVLGNSFALPACSGSVVSKWNNCFGSWADKKGNKYLGEFKSGTYHGQGTYTWPDGVKYVGENKNGKANGKGTQTWPDGTKYVGDFKDDKRNGMGAQTNSDGSSYVGEFKDGEYHGQGTYTWSSGRKYVGEHKNGKANGKGIETYADGNSYVGEYKDDKRNGQGTFTYRDGAKYVGEYKDDKRNGRGTLTFPDGEKYVGQFKDSKYNGQGTFTFANGSSYTGEFKDDERNGQGTFTFADGISYAGEFKDDKYNGQGTLVFPDDRKYVGEFKDGEYNGQGTLIFSDGSSYAGEFKDGEYNGRGTFAYAEGGKYVGEFKDGEYSGQGIDTNANGAKYVGEWKSGQRDGNGITYRDGGSIQESGIYKDGELVTSQNIDPNSFTRIGSNNTAPAVTAVQLLEMERKAAQLEEGRVRLAKEREQLNAEKLQREREEQLKLAQNAPSPVAVQSTKRIALVIGNASYSTRPLKNPRNDADDISRALKTANFDVIDLRDATLSQMRSAVRQFGDKLLNNDVGLVYYSGHGVEVKGKNFFLAVNADIQREDEIADQGLDVALILEKMTTAGKGVNILIVDACRDDPFGRSFRSSSKGLATMDAPRGTIIAYSTSPGKVASDGDPKARNSPYTKALLQAMQAPNRPIEQVFKDVRRSVQAETKDQQTPWENTSLSGDFYFRVQK